MGGRRVRVAVYFYLNLATIKLSVYKLGLDMNDI